VRGAAGMAPLILLAGCTRSYYKAMRQTEARMTPVITAFRDQVTFLKHNLNARAIGSLKGTSAKISTDVDVLMISLDASMAQADSLINSLNADQC
jgi:hypothetical protein